MTDPSTAAEGLVVSLALHVKAAPRDPSEAGGVTRAARFFDTLRTFAIAHGASFAGPSETAAGAVFERDSAEEAAAVALEAIDLARAVDALDPLLVRVGVALGPAAVSEAVAAPILEGPALETAEKLAERARPGEVRVDPEARRLLEPIVFFERAPRKAAHGSVLHAAFPWRRDSAGLVETLPVPPLVERVAHRRSLEEATAAPATWTRVLVVRAAPGLGGTRLLDEALAAAGARFIARGSGADDSDEPLGTLRRAIRSVADTLARELDAHPALGDLVAGRAIRPYDAATGLEKTLAAAAERGRRVALLFDPLERADDESVEVLGLLSAAAADPPLLIGVRCELELPLPRGLEKARDLREVSLQPLGAAAQKAIVASMLGGKASAAIQSRLVAHSDGTPVAIVESVRDAIESGILVPSPEGFHPLEDLGDAPPSDGPAIVLRRLDRLPQADRRLLEAVSIVGDGAVRGVFERVTATAGSGTEKTWDAVARLERRGWVRRAEGNGAGPALSSETVRATIAAHLDPAVAKALHTMAALAYKEVIPAGQKLRRAVHLVRSSQLVAAIPVVLEAAQDLRQAGLTAAADRAGALVPLRADGAPSEQAPGFEDPTEPAHLGEVALLQAGVALMRRDFEAVDRAATSVAAAGGNPSLVDRLRGVSKLASGDLPGAMALFERALDYERDAASAGGEARAALGVALALEQAGDTLEAARMALRGVGAARSAGDLRGEQIAQRVLSSALGSGGFRDAARRVDEAQKATRR